MTNELHHLYQYNFAFFQKYPFLFSNRQPAAATIKDYFNMCGYHPDKPPLIVGASNFGIYHPDMLIKYEPNFLYHLPEATKLGYTFVFNFGNDTHLWAYCYNFPDHEKDKPRFVIMPAFYSLQHEKIVNFYKENAEWAIKPSPKPQTGMGFFAAPPEPPEYIPVI